MKVFILEDMSGDEIVQLDLCLFFDGEEGNEVVGTYKFCAWPSRGYFVKDSRSKHIYRISEFTKAMPLGELYLK